MHGLSEDITICLKCQNNSISSPTRVLTSYLVDQTAAGHHSEAERLSGTDVNRPLRVCTCALQEHGRVAFQKQDAFRASPLVRLLSCHRNGKVTVAENQSYIFRSDKKRVILASHPGNPRRNIIS